MLRACCRRLNKERILKKKKMLEGFCLLRKKFIFNFENREKNLNLGKKNNLSQKIP
jgi:hypothetical protein